jgi:exonuclease III
MRLVTWNLGHMTPATHYKEPENRDRQWRFLLDLNAHIMMLQECLLDDLPEFESETGPYEIVGTIRRAQSACSALIVKTELHPAAAPRAGVLFDFLGKYLALASVDSAVGRLQVCSVHTPVAEVHDVRINDEQDRRLRRSNGRRAMYNDVAFAALDALPKESGFVFAGDWNTARRFDETYPDGGAESGASGAEFFVRAAERGWSETMRAEYTDEVPTFLRQGQPYENDHIFTDARLHARLSKCKVIYEVDGSPAVQLSDHAPIVADFDLETSC